MYKLITAVAVTLFACSAYAEEKAPTPQQSKMAACSKENKGLKGDEFKKAQKECMSKEAPAKAAAGADKPAGNQKDKMANCSKENKGLKGEEFKKAQKECLSK